MKPVVFLIGPTASGKTEIALCLARRLGGEIISADSMQVYRGMDIGTAKPTAAEQKKVSHHLIDVARPHSHFSVHRYRSHALSALKQIGANGKLPIVVGGSGLYLAVLWKGLSGQPGKSLKARKRLDEMYEREGPVFLHKRLQKIDPVRAQKIHPHDKHRILRALEIWEVSGRRPSEWHQKKGETLEDLGFCVRIFGIERNREELYRRIDQRVERMIRKGWLAEVKKLQKAGFSRTGTQALGYKQILDYLKEGRNRKSDLIRHIQNKTRQFAKRQLTWFRREKAIQWIPWKTGTSSRQICGSLEKEIRAWLKTVSC